MSYFDDHREITPDEGFRDTDWDSHLREPAFYTHALPCESCGKPVLGDRAPAEWDLDLHVGPCCAFSLNLIPDLPTCPALWPALEHCTSVQEVSLAMALHLAECPSCQEKRKELAGAISERKAA